MRNFFRATLCSAFLFSTVTYAEMDRVYHPYVEQNEREIEYGLTWRDPDGTSLLLQRAGFGYAWGEKIFTEAYVLTESMTHEDQQVKGYEIELKWQLTDQGEYWADWGLLAEAATAKEIDSQELAIGLLWEKELNSRWVAASNLMFEYEYGDDIQDEFESAFKAQLRYRKNMSFEPAWEVYLDDQDWATGPAMIGALRVAAGQQVRWELGVLFGIDSKTPDTNVRFNLEYEF